MHVLPIVDSVFPVRLLRLAFSDRARPFEKDHLVRARFLRLRLLEDFWDPQLDEVLALGNDVAKSALHLDFESAVGLVGDVLLVLLVDLDVVDVKSHLFGLCDR